MTHLERDGAPAVLMPWDGPPSPRAVWCGALIEYRGSRRSGKDRSALARVTNTTTDPRHADCPECWAAVRRAREVEP